jgi:opacity protein-like surface antigen
MEAGLVIAIKYEWPLTQRFHPYIWDGGGVMYFTQHLHEESTQYAFSPQGGAGFSFFLDKHTAISVEYSYRHFSNANLKLPNDGMNQGFVNMGLTWYF